MIKAILLLLLVVFAGIELLAWRYDVLNERKMKKGQDSKPESLIRG